MKWSDRKMEEFERNSKFAIIKKFVVVGKSQDINFDDLPYKQSSAQGKFSNRRQSEPALVDPYLLLTENLSGEHEKTFLMTYNMIKCQVENLKILKMPSNVQVTAINFGPFDNGYLLIGLSCGVLLALDFHSLDVILSLQIFKRNEPIKTITFEPTNLVFVASKNKEVVSLNLVKKEMHYVYVELGKRQFSTIAMPIHNIEKSQRVDGMDDNYQYQTHPLKFCC